MTPAGTEAARPARRRARVGATRLPKLRRGSPALTAVAATVLAASMLLAVHLRWGGWVPFEHHAGTAFLGTSTCADWQGAGDSERSRIVAALGSAATGPDPENPGATLGEGEAYLLLDRACSTHLSRSFLLYEIYNRAAVFAPLSGTAPASGGFSSDALSH